MTIIEKDAENMLDIEELYNFGIVLFETTVLIMDDIEYCICWVPFKKIYDISIQNIKHTKIISYEAKKELSEEEKIYFDLLKGETIKDERGNIIKCISHSIEYGL